MPTIGKTFLIEFTVPYLKAETGIKKELQKKLKNLYIFF
jgi:hypothetical protein